MMAANTLYYGDNLDILRNSVDDESVDLVYLDPPFNSSRNYNVLFKRAKRDENQAQQVAFEDTWEWSTRRYEEFRNDPRNLILLPIMESLYGILSTSEMMAYLVMMAPRLVELKRVLKPTGSLYLHCDPVASHYLKILLDVIFAPLNFINEVTWKRTSSHNDARRKFGDVCDILLVYGRTSGYYFKPQYRPYDQGYLDSFYRYYDEDGRRYRLDNLRSPNPRPNLTYEYKGYQPHANGWAISREKMEKLDAEGRLAFPSSLEGRIQLKRYLDEMPGMPVGNLWDDIPPIHAHSAERMGYPTQKPLALLERILSASSREGDVVLDPFCGCGTATVAAERLGRKWIGIDITYIAIDLIMQRLSEEFALERGKQYRVIGAPQDAYAARKLFEESPKQFEVWAVANLANGIPQPEKSGDKGVDGKVYFDDLAGKLRYAVVQVKGGHLTPGIIRDFAHVIDREKAVMGYFICLETPTPGMYSTAEDAGMVTAPNGRLMPKMQILTVRELMDEGKLFDAPQGYTLKTGSRLLKRANEQGSLGI